VRSSPLIEDDDRLVFAVSGGKDSIACLDMVYRLESRRGLDMAVLAIDEGIAGYRSPSLEIARGAAEERGLEFHLFTFKETWGHDMDSIIALLGSPERACTYCGVLRRWLINRSARELGATKIVTGHNLDDEVQSCLLNLIRGDPARLARSGPEYLLKHPKFIPRVKPLRRIPGKEALLYDDFVGLEHHDGICPYSSFDMRNSVRSFLDAIEEDRPTSKASFLSTADRLAESYRRSLPEMHLGECRVCGEPTMGEVCKTCELLASIGI
jgi:uncharacterized protein (TIGR00269 family)